MAVAAADPVAPPGAKTAAAVTDPGNPVLVKSERVALGLAVLSGVMYFLGFAGFEFWPLALLSGVPLLAALRGRTGWRAVRLGWLMGTVTNAGGFYWIVAMLKTFSGFPTWICALFSVLLYAGQGLEFGAFAMLVTRADRNRVHRLISVPAALAALELAFPLLFPSYTANSLHNVPVLIQIADLGGPILIGAIIALTWAGIELAIVQPRLANSDAPGAPALTGATPKSRLMFAALPVALWLLAIPYGFYRIAEVDRENATVPALRVGVVQENLGLMEKRNDPETALERHLATTRQLESDGAELVVWSESAVAFIVPEHAHNVRQVVPEWDLHVPVLFGALSRRNRRYYNTAFITNADGELLATYDKTFLLAFGEYLPGGESFPQFYQWSPHSGHFTPGSRQVAMPLPGHTPEAPRTVAPLICYEDILPRFVREFQTRTDSSLLAVILNDAWFGESAEPWIHFALSKFRSIEHRRDFVRAANSGVSGFVDAAGRVISHTGTFSRESRLATVHLRTRRTPYYYVGDWAAWLGVLATAWMLTRRRRVAAG